MMQALILRQNGMTDKFDKKLVECKLLDKLSKKHNRKLVVVKGLGIYDWKTGWWIPGDEVKKLKNNIPWEKAEYNRKLCLNSNKYGVLKNYKKFDIN
jgi:hypothetical protein